MTVDKADKTRTRKLQFHYIKGPDYREIACHGAIGGVTSQNKIWMALFSERGPIPRVVEFEVSAPEGVDAFEFNEAQAVPSHTEGRSGIIRHVEFNTYLDLDVATRLRDWLDQRIAEMEGKGKPRKAPKKR
jgi:hypothetical protein